MNRSSWSSQRSCRLSGSQRPRTVASTCVSCTKLNLNEFEYTQLHSALFAREPRALHASLKLYHGISFTIRISAKHLYHAWHVIRTSKGITFLLPRTNIMQPSNNIHTWPREIICLLLSSATDNITIRLCDTKYPFGLPFILIFIPSIVLLKVYV